MVHRGAAEASSQQPSRWVSCRCSLRGLLSELAEGGRNLSAALMEELVRFTGESWEQEDDITLVTLRRAAASR
jgi:hypothetical protein